MIRQRDTTSPYAPTVGTDLWTVYDDGDLPTQDFTIDGSSRTNVTRYMLGMAETDEATGDNSFVHTNHLGTTGALTDDAGAVEVSFVYTAFGERVDSNGFVTRSLPPPRPRLLGARPIPDRAPTRRGPSVPTSVPLPSSPTFNFQP
jgi:hypothetical protein